MMFPLGVQQFSSPNIEGSYLYQLIKLNYLPIGNLVSFSVLFFLPLLFIATLIPMIFYLSIFIRYFNGTISDQFRVL